MKIRFICVLILLFLFFIQCSPYRPNLYPSYDVLRPGLEVQILGSVGLDGRAIDEQGKTLTEGIVINQAMVIWIYELQAEILKLRKGK